jgi:apolipoprotein N-acyltransferase
MTATPTTLQDPHGRPQPTPPNRRARAVMPLAMALPVAAAAAVLMDLAYPEVDSGRPRSPRPGCCFSP